MTYEAYNEELARLKIAESGAIGGLKGTVAGILIRHDVGLDMALDDFARLRDALDRGGGLLTRRWSITCASPVELL